MNHAFSRKTPLVFILFFTLFWHACQNGTLPEIPDPDPTECDTINVSFSKIIVPILEQHCYNGCHNGGNPTGGFTLDSYVGVKDKVDQNRLYGAVAQLSGFVAMPFGKGRIPDCEIAQIKAWIDRGALDN